MMFYFFIHFSFLCTFRFLFLWIAWFCWLTEPKTVISSLSWWKFNNNNNNNVWVCVYKNVGLISLHLQSSSINQRTVATTCKLCLCSVCNYSNFAVEQAREVGGWGMKMQLWEYWINQSINHENDFKYHDFKRPI